MEPHLMDGTLTAEADEITTFLCNEIITFRLDIYCHFPPIFFAVDERGRAPDGEYCKGPSNHRESYVFTSGFLQEILISTVSLNLIICLYRI